MQFNSNDCTEEYICKIYLTKDIFDIIYKYYFQLTKVHQFTVSPELNQCSGCILCSS